MSSEDPEGWEYKKISNVSAKQMNYLAQNGWEPVSAAPGAMSLPGVNPITTVFRKRRQPVDPNAPKPPGLLDFKGRRAQATRDAAAKKARQANMSFRERLEDNRRHLKAMGGDGK